MLAQTQIYLKCQMKLTTDQLQSQDFFYLILRLMLVSRCVEFETSCQVHSSGNFRLV